MIDYSADLSETPAFGWRFCNQSFTKTLHKGHALDI